jgi:3-deoxy-manno-octulosonate cytidylyltransferase (CMP-KDO synthetase)
MLSQLLDKPLLQWVFERASRVACFDEVVFAIDSEEIAAVIEGFSGKWHLTSESCLCGTERLVELKQRAVVSADIWVNWQGDEPFISEAMIADLLQSCGEEEGDVWTLKKRIVDLSEVDSPQIAKVVCDQHGHALYFSRSPIPHYRDAMPDEKKIFYKHVGLYAFSKEALDKIAHFGETFIENAEQLEQLRFLYYNLRVRVHETEHEVFGIDLPEHLARAELEFMRFSV